MKLKITIDDKAYEVDVEVAESESPTSVRYVATGSSAQSKQNGAAKAAAAPQTSDSVADEAKACRSPLSGVVSEIQVAEGEAVNPDQSVIVLEAMKMFTSITSPLAGKVKTIHVAKGDAVKQGQLLIEFE